MADIEDLSKTVVQFMNGPCLTDNHNQCTEPEFNVKVCSCPCHLKEE